MPKHMIMPIDNSLSFEARGMLGTMLNNPESDYRTAEELCCFFEKDSLRTIRECSTRKDGEKSYLSK